MSCGEEGGDDVNEDEDDRQSRDKDVEERNYSRGLQNKKQREGLHMSKFQIQGLFEWRA